MGVVINTMIASSFDGVQLGGDLGTPSAGNLANCTFPTLNQDTTGNAATATYAASDMAIFAVAETHKAAMLASADPKNYDFSAGWPQEYQP